MSEPPAIVVSDALVSVPFPGSGPLATDPPQLPAPYTPGPGQQPTVQAMRSQVVIRELARIAGTIALLQGIPYLVGRRPHTGEPEQVTHHTAPDWSRLAYDDLIAANAAHGGGRAQAAVDLLNHQIGIHTEATQATLCGIVEEALASGEHFRRLHREAFEAYFADPLPTRLALDLQHGQFRRAVLESDFLRGVVEAPLRYFAFIVHRHHADWQQALATGDVPAAAHACAEYYSLLGRGIRYRIGFEINRRCGEEEGFEGRRHPFKIPFHLHKIPGIHRLERRGQEIEAIAGLLAEGTTVDTAIRRKQEQLAEIAKKRDENSLARKIHGIKSRLGWVGTLLLERRLLLNGYETQGRNVRREIAVLQRVQDLVRQHGTLERALDMLAAGYDMRVWKLGSATGVDGFPGLTKTAASLKAREQVLVAEMAQKWTGHDARATALFQAALQDRVLLEESEKKFQLARYEGLYQQVIDAVPFMAHFKSVDRYAAAKRAYTDAFAEMHRASRELAAQDPQGARSNPGSNLKRAELKCFLAFLKLHWTVRDLAEKDGFKHPDGIIRPVSFVFANQCEILNSPAAEGLAGLQPLFLSMSVDRLFDLYSEVLFYGNNPLHLDRIMARWGCEAARMATGTLNVYGGQDLAGEFGQGSSMLARSALYVDPAIVGLGISPHALFINSNHFGFKDYANVVGMSVALGLFRGWITYEANNFSGFPILGVALDEGDGFDLMRGGKGERERITRAFESGARRGVSPMFFDPGSNMVAATRDPLQQGPAGLVAPRGHVWSASATTASESAQHLGRWTTAIYHEDPTGGQPDFALSKEIGMNFSRGYSTAAGARLRQLPIHLALSPAFPASAMPPPGFRMAACTQFHRELARMQTLVGRPVPSSGLVLRSR